MRNAITSIHLGLNFVDDKMAAISTCSPNVGHTHAYVLAHKQTWQTRWKTSKLKTGICYGRHSHGGWCTATWHCRQQAEHGATLRAFCASGMQGFRWRSTWRDYVLSVCHPVSQYTCRCYFVYPYKKRRPSTRRFSLNSQMFNSIRTILRKKI